MPRLGDKRSATLEDSREERLKELFYSVIALLVLVYALTLGLVNFFQGLNYRFNQRIIDVGRDIYLTGDYGTRVIPLALGGFMLLVAYQLWLRKRAAVMLIAAFIFLNSALDLIRKDNIFIALSGLVLVAVILKAREGFPARPDPYYLNRFWKALPLILTAFFVYGMGGLYILHERLGISANPLYLAYRAVTISLGYDASEGFVGWITLFRDSLVILFLVGSSYLLFLIFHSHRPQTEFRLGEYRRARELIKFYGSDSISYFSLREDKSLFFPRDEVFLAYRCLGGMAIFSGDPVGPEELITQAVRDFQDYCLERGWRVAGFGCQEQFTPHYRQAGFKHCCLGEEPVIHLDEFSLQGRKVKTLRHAVTKLQKMGFTIEFMFNVGIPDHLRHELGRIAMEWREGKPETGFAMGLGRLLHSEDNACLLGIAYDPVSKPVGFVYLVPMFPHGGYSLDTSRTVPGAPNGLTEFMLAKTAFFLKEKGFKYMSLHFCFLSQHYRQDREEGSSLLKMVANIVDLRFPVISLYNFDKKFQPHWKKRYMIYQSFLDLPRALLTVLVAESAIHLRRGNKLKRRGKR